MQTGQLYKLLIRLFNFLVSERYKSLCDKTQKLNILQTPAIEIWHLNLYCSSPRSWCDGEESSSFLTHNIQPVDNICYV